MPIAPPALTWSKMSGIHRGPLGICQEDQASGRQKVFCDWNKEVGEVALVNVMKGK